MVKTKPARFRTSDRSLPPARERQSFDSLVKTLESQLDELRAQVRQAQQLAGLGTAAATIAHEFNNFLTPIRSYAQAALGGDDPELMRKALEVTLRHVEILTSMSDRLLEVSSATTSEPKDCALRTIANDAVESLCRDVQKDGIRLRIEVEDTLMAHVDPLQMQQVLFNLLLNARSAMAGKHNGVLRISGRRDGPCVVLEVSDTGKGISPAMLPHIFEPYRSTKTGKTNGRKRCSGLGLALCRDLVEDNGGTISVTSEEGSGTTFTIMLLAAKDASPTLP